jgi:hypothetical protein
VPDTQRATATDTATAAVFVLGLEGLQGSLTIGDYQVAVQRLERSVRSWDTVVAVGPRTVGVICTSMSGPREVDAVAKRFSDVVRAPMAVGDEIRQIGVCVGSALVQPGEAPKDAIGRAREAMQQMRSARRSLIAPDLPRQRADQVTLPE